MVCFENESGRVNFIICDSHGQVLMSAYKLIRVLNSLPKGDALALIFGLQLACETSFTILNVLGLLMKNVLSLSNYLINFSHLLLEANEPAHHLARFASIS